MMPACVSAGAGKAPREVFEDHVSGLLEDRAGTETVDLRAEYLARTFADCRFFVLRFSSFPVSVVPPAPLKSSNVLVVRGESVTQISTERELERFFRERVSAPDAAARLDATRSWLRLAGELRNDGYFEYQAPVVSMVDPATSTGVLAVVPERGNKGQLSVRLKFAQGKLTEVAGEGQLLPGIRPRCQALRLLDPDPVVREIMRRDLLVLGARGRDYLERARAEAGPALQTAIDEVWAQIVAEGR